nr:reverse transcriptase domain-containing protein [Tanacetum cinerariifolium]
MQGMQGVDTRLMVRIVKDDHGVNPPHIYECCCECGEALDGIICQQCACKSCGKGAHIGYNCPPKFPIISNPESCNQTMNNEPPQTLPSFDSTCYSDKEISVPCVSKPNFVDESSNIFNPPPNPIHSCEFCRSNAQYGHYCTPQAPFINPEPVWGPHENFQCQPLNYYEPNPMYDSNYSGFDQFGDFHPQQDLCCDNCGGLHETSQCRPMNQNFYNSNSIGFDQTQPPQFLVVHPPPQETSIEISHDQENVINSVQTFLRKFNHYSFFKMPKVLLLAWDRVFEIKDAFENKQYKLEDIQELFRKLLDDLQNIHEELVEFINSPGWNLHVVYDDDDDDVDYTIAITPVLSTKEPDNSLSMRDEHLDTILTTELDEAIKSSVEDLVPILSEFKGIPDTMCNVHLVNNPTPLEAKDHFEIVINSNNDYSSSDDDSLYYENIEYVEASPHDSELVILEVEKIVISEDEEIKDDNLREKLLKQRFDESFSEAWDRFNDLLRACPHHGFSELHQLDTFYNALNVNDQDSLNSAAGGNFLDKLPFDFLKIIESKSKVRQSRAKAVVAKVNSNSSTPAISSDVAKLKDIVRALLLHKKNQSSTPAPSPTPASVKAVESNCVTCGAANYNQGNTSFCPQMVANQIRPLEFHPVQNNQNNFNRGNNFTQNRGVNFNQSNFNPSQLHRPQVNQALAYQAPIPQTQSVSQTDFERYVKANDAVLRNIESQGQSMQNQCQNIQNKYQTVQNQLANLMDMMSKFMSSNMASSSGSGTLPGNTVTNPKEDLKAHVQPPVTQSKTPVSEPIVAPVSAPIPNLKPLIPYPSRRDNGRRREQANEKIEKFYEIFKDMSFEISFMDALILMPKFASTLKALIGNKEKLSEMARTPMNEHCFAVILNKLPKKLRDPEKFLIPCEFPGMDECLALADLDASINLMPLSMWKELALPELTLTCMTLELVDRSVSKPIGIAKDVSVKVGMFHFPADFVVVDFAPDPRVPLILRRCFLKTGRALIDVYKGDDKLPVIIAKELGDEEKAAIIKVLKSHKRAIAWKLSDIQGINSEFCTHKILMEEDYKPAVQHQRRVNPKIHDVIKKEVEKLLDAGLITRSLTVHGSARYTAYLRKVCIDYQKLNEATRKDHFPLPFMDQMLERLAGNEYYCFLDGFSGYFQIPIDHRDQEKTTFTCPYGTFAYHCMPFGLCNAPGTF